MIAACLALFLAPGDLSVTNIEAGTLVRYPLVMLRGTTHSQDVAAGLSWKAMIRFKVAGGRFVALVELKPGENMVLLTSGDDVLRMRLDYRPMTTPYKVATIYVAPKDEKTDFDAPPGMEADQYGEKLDTAMKLLQCFTAESMSDAGYGRKTFPLEFNQDGKVAVHVVRSPLIGDELRAMDGQALWASINDLLSPKFPYDVYKCCAVMSFSRYSPVTHKTLGHTALGGGGLGVFGSASMYTWPTTIQDIPHVFEDDTPLDPSKGYDDSAGRDTVWASASTTIGAVMHEMGHTFGLPHTIDSESIMSRGFDNLNRVFTVVEPPDRIHPDYTYFKPNEVAYWSPFFAARLNWNPWFQPDGPAGGKFLAALPPTIERDGTTGEAVIRSNYGLRVVGGECDGKPSIFQSFVESAPHVVRLKEADLRSKIGSDAFTVYALDEQGNEARLEIRP